MPSLRSIVTAALPSAALVLLLAVCLPVAGHAQDPLLPQLPQGVQLTPQQVRDLLRSRPDLVQQLRERVAASGLTPAQVRARLRAAGYPEDLLDDYLMDADTTRAANPPAPRAFDAVRSLGILSGSQVDSLRRLDSLRRRLDSLDLVADSTRRDSSRADSLRLLADSAAREPGRTFPLRLFGTDAFRRASNRFEPDQAGPVDENYRLGPGDALVLILTGDVEQAYTLDVTREGFVVIPQVGQLYVANQTLGQVEELLYRRLGAVYSGVRRGPNARTRFQLSLARLRKIQVYVIGEVVRAGSYQLSAAGTALAALYAAGGPTDNGSFRRVELRRGDRLVDSLDIYDYLLHGINRTDLRLQNGDVVFVPIRGGLVRVAGRVIRPAIYEVKPTETLRDVVNAAGGFDATAFQQRVQIHRTLPPDGTRGGPRVVIDVGPEQFVGGAVPAVPMAAGDSVTVFAGGKEVRRYVTVAGDVWIEGVVGLQSGMKLSDALRLAGGVKPDVYLDQILITRLRDDSTRVQLRSAFADSSGRVRDDIELADRDEITVFSRRAFQAQPWVVVTGAVRKPGRFAYRQGMTARDAILLAGGLGEDASLHEAEIARVPADHPANVLAQSLPLTLDSTYVFARGTDGGYAGVPGQPAPATGAPETALAPYDNVLIRRTPNWDYQRTVKVTGQVQYPGPYTLRSRNARLTDILKEAGGLTPSAYAAGITFFRQRDLAGRIGVDLPAVLRNPKHTDNLILAEGDSINIPEVDQIVLVGGAVNAPGAVPYTPGFNIDDYIRAAGGFSRRGDRSRAYVTQPNGKVQSVRRRFLLADALPQPRAGGRVFVPERDLQAPASNTLGYLTAFASLLSGLATVIALSRR